MRTQTVNTPPRLTALIGSSFLMRITSAGLEFGLSFGLARLLAPTSFGAYDYTDSALTIFLMFSLLGFDRLLIRKFASYKVQNRWSEMRGIWWDARRMSLSIAAALIVIVWIVTQLPVAFIPQEPEARYALQVAVIVLPLWTLVKLYFAAVQGTGNVLAGQVSDFFVRPLLFISLIFISGWIFQVQLSAPLVILFQLCAVTAALALSLYVFRRSVPPEYYDAPTTHDDRHTWMASNIPLLLISGMTLVNLRGGSLILGALDNLETVGLYGVSVRVAALIALILTSLNAVVAPTFSRLYTLGETEKLQHVLSRSVRITMMVSLPVGLILIVFGETILGLFGERFQTAHSALILLSIGQLFNASAGPVNWLLIMTGHEWDAAKAVSFGALLSIALMVIFVPRFQLEGAALAAAISMSLQNIVLIVLVKRRLGIYALPFMRKNL